MRHLVLVNHIDFLHLLHRDYFAGLFVTANSYFAKGAATDD
jgi:hypothetical protein